ncbi:acyl-CoA thioesterase [Streptomyces sp. NPDC005808]|uniref:acyl-CoA thioesterase n=1 Tax=Streptomyces sp. NPDC005808 TaxID=3364734 RepID=UPI0036BC93C9
MFPEKSHTESVSVFFDDLDSFGMVYHGRFAALIEHGVTTYFAGIGLGLGHEDINCVVRELAVTFEQPITKIGSVDVTFWIEALGRTSAKFAFRFHSGETVHARGHRVIIKMDPKTLRPAPWTDPTRKLLEDNLLVAGASGTV